jgi:predicted dehydrogenase
MAQATRIGVVGAGVISHAYLSTIDRCPALELAAICSKSHVSAEKQAARYGGKAVRLAEMLADPAIDIILNLAPPSLHHEIGRQVLEAGKHLYCEKPFATSLGEAHELLAIGEDKGLSIGCATDTFLGPAHQATRRALDAGLIGKVTGGAACMQSHGMEHWHPTPDFFYQPGGGPHLDLGPYYVTLLVFLLGPVAEVTAFATQPARQRTCLGADGRERTFPVDVPTTFHGSLLFESGAQVALSLSWDVWKHGRNPIELYGDDGSLIGADPNDFTGGVETSVQGGEWTAYEGHARPPKKPVVPAELIRKAMAMLTAGVDPFTGKPLGKGGPIPINDLRGLGLVDLASAIRERRAPRASGLLATHVLEILLGLEAAARERRIAKIRTRVERPELSR